MSASRWITGAIMACRRGYATGPHPDFRAVLGRFVAALPGLLLVGVIFGGIRAGVFTAIESASIAVVYAVCGPVLFVGTASGRISVGATLRATWPFYLAVLVVLLGVSFVPALSLWLPSLLR